MEITEKKVTIAELTAGYEDKKENGVFGYSGRLEIRPSFQREFVYKDDKRNAVIDTVLKGFPLNVMYWSKTGDDAYEVLDGQQRTISICQYCNGDFAVKVNGNDKFIHNLTQAERERLLGYRITVCVCEGDNAEKLEWFKTINIAGVTLTAQELLNATYTGAWLADAKRHFSKRECVAVKKGAGYVKGNSIRQDYLEKALEWIADRDNAGSAQLYMAIHQNDPDANELWNYYQTVIAWASINFPVIRKGITDCQEWGILFNRYRANNYNSNSLETEIKRLLLDDDVTKKAGIIPYLLSEGTDEKALSIRAFTDAQKLRAYERQNHRCPHCLREGFDREYEFSEMQGDHIIPWSKGGRTTDDNLQMLCAKCNNRKGSI